MRGGAVPAIHGRRDSPPVPHRHDDRPYSENCRGARAVGEAMPDKRYGKRRVKSVPWPMSWPGAQAASPVPRAIRRRAGIGVGARVPRPVPSGASRRARRCRKRRGAGSEERATVDEECRHRIRAPGGERPKTRRSPSRLPSVSSPCRRSGRVRSRPAPGPNATVGGGPRRYVSVSRRTLGNSAGHLRRVRSRVPLFPAPPQGRPISRPSRRLPLSPSSPPHPRHSPDAGEATGTAGSSAVPRGYGRPLGPVRQAADLDRAVRQ